METNTVGIEWRDVPKLPTIQASRCGKIRSKNKGRILHDFNNGKGYRYLTLSSPVRSNYYIHRIIAETWCDNPHSHNEINHKDFNKSNNHADNLEWVSRNENMLHNLLNGRVSHGERHKQSRLKVHEILCILNEFLANPKQNKTHAGNRYGVNDTAIHKILKGKRWVRYYNKWLLDNNLTKDQYIKLISIRP